MSITTYGMGSAGGLVCVQGFGGIGRWPRIDACILLALLNNAEHVLDLQENARLQALVLDDASLSLWLLLDAQIDLLDDGLPDIVLSVGQEAEIVLDLPLDARLELQDDAMEPSAMLMLKLAADAALVLCDTGTPDFVLDVGPDAAFVIDLDGECGQ